MRKHIHDNIINEGIYEIIGLDFVKYTLCLIKKNDSSMIKVTVL
jgi:hypothetical protein